MKYKYKNSYSGSTMNSFYRALSDLYSMQFCDIKEAELYAINYTEGTCGYCGKKLYKEIDEERVLKNINFDHIYPASNLNLFTKGNILLSCNSCNNKKSDIDPIVFVKQLILNNKSKYKNINEFKDFLKKFRQPYVDKYPKFSFYGKNIKSLDNDFVKEVCSQIDFSKSLKWYKTANKDFFKDIVEFWKSRFKSIPISNYRYIFNDLISYYPDKDFSDYQFHELKSLLADYVLNSTAIHESDKRRLCLLILLALDEDETKKCQSTFAKL